MYLINYIIYKSLLKIKGDRKTKMYFFFSIYMHYLGTQ